MYCYFNSKCTVNCKVTVNRGSEASCQHVTARFFPKHRIDINRITTGGAAEQVNRSFLLKGIFYFTFFFNSSSCHSTESSAHHTDMNIKNINHWTICLCYHILVLHTLILCKENTHSVVCILKITKTTSRNNHLAVTQAYFLWSVLSNPKLLNIFFWDKHAFCVLSTWSNKCLLPQIWSQNGKVPVYQSSMKRTLPV